VVILSKVYKIEILCSYSSDPSDDGAGDDVDPWGTC